MKKLKAKEYLTPVSELIFMDFLEPIATSPLDPYHPDNPGGPGSWDDEIEP